MVFGFGFNKAKVLASAEKNVKQGKLNAAIADYEKIAKEDPKDLNILNTLGDLYARVGNLEQATSCFKRVGEAYASEGFTVKAIAMYKKLTKHNPKATDAIMKMAELYTQQGLYNDARMQYMVVADQFLANNELEPAVVVLQKVLEFDAQNPQLQGRLAELYVKLGRKSEARDIYFRNAQAMRARGALEACDQALAQALQMDPSFSQAALMRGQVKLENNDAQGAVQCLEMLPDIDSRPEGLRVLLRAQLKLGNHAEAEPVAQKLFKVHNDPSGIAACAESLMAAGNFDAALRLYQEHSDRLLATDAAALIQNLHSLIGRVKNDSRALEFLQNLFQKAGNTTHLAEITELLAHAYVQEGALDKARDLYQQLADLEPENPLHLQNYKQIMAKLGEDVAETELPLEEGTEPLLVDDLEQAAPAIEQNYPTPVRNAVREALTDSELFSSYNLPNRAIRPLEMVLPQAPADIRLNQRLASLYARLGRAADAARCCSVLAGVYEEGGRREDASRYADLAAKYRRHAGLPPESTQKERTSVPEPAIATSESSLGHPTPQALPHDVAPVTGDVPLTTNPPVWAIQPGGKTEETSSGGLSPEAAVAPAGASDVGRPDYEASPESKVQAEAGAHEIDLSEEWGRILAGAEPVTTDVAAADATVRMWEAPEQSASASQAAPEPPAQSVPAMEAALSDILEEAQFYLSQKMWAEARAAFARAEAMSPASPAVADIRAQLAQAESEPDNTASIEIEPIPEQSPEPLISAPDTSWKDAPQFPSAEAASTEFVVDPEIAEVAAHDAAGGFELPAEAGWARTAGVLRDSPALVAGSEQHEESELFLRADEFGPALVQPQAGEPIPLDDIAAAATFEKDPAVPADIGQTAARTEASPAGSGGDLLGELALDLEQSLQEKLAAESFATGTATGSLAAPPTPPVMPPEAPTSRGGAQAAAPAPVPPSPNAVTSTPEMPVPASTALERADDTGPAGSPVASEEHSSALSDLFAEFKQDLEGETRESEDPETHYNLGVAFKEMGLLDEAIGELQKVCHSIQHGTPFGQTVEAYTWLAHCFVEKGIPEAGIRWYENALGIPGLRADQTMAIHYELACAQQEAGNVMAARQHFMQVLSVNIDYRDVAERIKALRS
jgi:tetratricopeptide (TPR) repeat protein